MNKRQGLSKQRSTKRYIALAGTGAGRNWLAAAHLPAQCGAWSASSKASGDTMSTTLPPRDLFVGLPEQAVADLLGRMARRRLDTDQYLCRQGEPGDSLYLIVEGLVEVWLERGGDRELIARLRPGDAVGEMSLFTGEARAASVVAAVPTEVLELDAKTCADVVALHPVVLRNVAMMLVERQVRTNKQLLLRRERGEALALVVGEASADLADHGVAAAGRATPRGVALIDMTAAVQNTP